MITFAESKGKELIDWRKEINAVLQGNVPLPEREIELERAAMDWQQCAVGALDVRIPRGRGGDPQMPVDEELWNLGAEFGACFGTRQQISLEFCLELLDKIEKRAKEVLDTLSQA